MKSVALFSITLLFAQTAVAADQRPTAGADQQLHEIVFKNYPPRALAAGEEGPVFFVVKLGKDGAPTACQVTHGSGYPLLDEETCNLIVQHAVFTAAKDANGHSIKETAEGVVNWTLPGHTPAPINFSPAAAAAPSKIEGQLCRKTLRPGTLSSFERTCMTRSEWVKQSDEQKQTFEEMQGRKGSSRCSTTAEMGSGAAVAASAGASASGGECN